MAEPGNGVRVAFASSDGQSIDRHFGKADKFYVLSWKGDSFSLREVRELAPLCGELGHGDNFDQFLDSFCDCRIVLANAAGPAVVRGLAQRGGTFIPAEGPIDIALSRLAAAPQFKTLFIIGRNR